VARRAAEISLEVSGPPRAASSARAIDHRGDAAQAIVAARANDG